MSSCFPPQCPLPQELVDAVINQVDLNDLTSVQTLSACCTVSKSFYPGSRARLWTRLKIPTYGPRLAELYDVLVAAGDLAPLVQHLVLHCDETFPIQFFHIFPNVIQIDFIGEFEDLPGNVIEYITETWNVTIVSFQDSCLSKTALIAMIPLLSKVRRIDLIDCGVFALALSSLIRRRRETDSVACSPESLAIDLNGDGIILFIMAKKGLMSLQNVRRLAFSSFTDLAVDEEQSQKTVHKILGMIPEPLQELSFKQYNSISSNNDEEVLPIASIARISFEVDQDAKPLQTLDWWVRSLTNAWTNHRDNWAIEEIRIDVLNDANASPFRRRFPVVDLSAPAVWHALDSVLAAVKLNKLVVRVLTRNAVDDVQVVQFDQELRSAFALSRNRDIVCWGDIWRVV